MGIADLAERYGVSAIPIREALAALAADGLVQYFTNRGYYAKSDDFSLALNNLDLLQMMLIEAAYYLASTDARRSSIMRSLNRNFPTSAAEFAAMQPYDISSSLSNMFLDVGRSPHSRVIERTLHSLAKTVHEKVNRELQQEQFHVALRSYFRAISSGLPELAEFGAKRAISDLRTGLINAMTLG